MVIIGSVAVNPANGARLGKGEGPVCGREESKSSSLGLLPVIHQEV